nr:MAG TPA: NrdI Flavodoxin like [Caudoviricetes sp.]
MEQKNKQPKLVYYTKTGNTKRFVDKISGYESIELSPIDPFITLNEPYILVIPSYEPNVLPEIYETLDEFLEHGDNYELCAGTFSGGNLNFNDKFGVTAKWVEEKYDIPIIRMFEFQGGDRDVAELEKQLTILSNILLEQEAKQAFNRLRESKGE